MVELGPIMGTVPPLSTSDWLTTFEKYQQYPEYKVLNTGMDIEGFKTIFWFEYAHRLLGRTIGIAFLLPFLFFLAKRNISATLAPKLVAMFCLGVNFLSSVSTAVASSTPLTMLMQYRMSTSETAKSPPSAQPRPASRPTRKSMPMA